MSSKKSRFIRRIAFGLGVFTLCGTAFAGSGDATQLVQVAALTASYFFPAFTPVFMLISPVIGEAAVRRKVGRLS